MKNIFAANEDRIRMTWGVAPLPVGFVPVAVNLKMGSRNYGLLMHNLELDTWLVGAGLISHSIAPSEAIRIIDQVDMSTEHGGKRENAGRKKTLPAGAKTRSINLTDEEFEAVKNLIKEMRNQ